MELAFNMKDIIKELEVFKVETTSYVRQYEIFKTYK